MIFFNIPLPWLNSTWNKIQTLLKLEAIKLELYEDGMRKFIVYDP